MANVEPVEPAIHPLLLEVVLNNLFDTLGVEELLKCRLVCKSWLHNTSLRASLKKKSVIYLRCIFLHTTTTKESLSSYFQSGAIYNNFHFAKISYQNDLISRLFQVLGPTIKILKLQLDLNQLNIDQFRELIYERVPNLAELNIYSLSHDEVFLKNLFPSTEPLLLEPERPKHVNLQRLEMQEIRTPISRFMSQFFGSLSNLREITLKVEVCSDWSEQADLWRQNSPLATSIIKGLETSLIFKNLKVVRFGKLRTAHIESLHEMGNQGLQLEILEVHMPSKNSEEIFNAFISTQRKTLRQLIVFEQRSARYSHRPKQNGREEVFALRFLEIMPKLELLQLSKFPKSVMVSLYPVDYTRQCPRLNKLTLLGYSDGNGGLYIPTEKCRSLRELILWNRVHDPNIADILGHSFMNVTKLTVRYPTQDFLRALWSACDNIQNLTLFLEEGFYMDAGITGIPASIISRWAESSKFDSKEGMKEAYEWLECNENQKERSIRNLKDLRSLKLVVDHDDTCDRQVVCDASAHFALKEMTQLKYLELYSSHWHIGLTQCQFFSQDCCQMLKVNLDLTVIHFTPADES